MTPERWQLVEHLVQATLERPIEQRAAFVAESCRGDDELRGEVESMVTAYLASDDFLGDGDAEVDGIPAWRDLAALDRIATTSERSGVGHLVSGFAVPENIGPYRVVRELGCGGMGSVYLAERADEQFRHQVAIKVMRAGLERSIRRRFRSERQILASLEHVHIAKLYDGGTLDDGRPYIVMEYIQGTPIDTYCREQELSLEDRLTLFRAVCDAVHYAHKNLVLHLDIKPDNILVTDSGEVKLLDFGIAKLMRIESLATTAIPTSTGFRPMTPQYASPEQVQGQMLTTASDVYSLGMVLYRLLAGALPYRIDGILIKDLMPLLSDIDVKPPSVKVAERQSTAADDQRRSLTQLRHKLRGDLDAIALMALRKEPERRYGSVAELSDDVERYLERLPVVAKRGTFSYRVGKLVRRHKWAVGAVTGFFALILAFAIVVSLQARSLAHRGEQLKRERDKAQATAYFMTRLFHSVNQYNAKDGPFTAEQLLDNGVRLLEDSLGEYPDVHVKMQMTLARVYRYLDKSEKALATVEQGLHYARTHLSEQHPLVFDLQYELAAHMVSNGRSREAETLFLGILEHLERQYGPEHITLSRVLNALAIQYLEEGRFKEAQPYAERALTVHLLCERAPECLAKRRPALKMNTELMRMTVGWALSEQGQYEEAETLYQTSRERLEHMERTDHLYYAYALEGLAVNRHYRAPTASCAGPHCPRELLEQALSLLERSVGLEHRQAGTTGVSLGHVLLDQGQRERAVEQLSRSIALLTGKLPEEHTVLVKARRLLARAQAASPAAGATSPAASAASPEASATSAL